MKKRIVTLCMVVMLLICCVGNSSYAAPSASQNLYGEEIISSKTELEKHFYLNEPDAVSMIVEDGTPLIHMKRTNFDDGITVRLRSLKKMESSYFTYTVVLASKKLAQLSFCELPIFVGSDADCKRFVQVYVNKSAEDSVTVNTALLEDGKFNKIGSQTAWVQDAALDDTFFEIRLEVYGEDMDIYLNDEYVNTITEMDGFAGYVGVRCSGEMKVKSISLVENMPETESAAPSQTTSPEETFSFPEENPTTNVSYPPQIQNQPTATATASNDSFGIFTLSIILGVVAVIVASATVIYIFVTKKKR